MFKNGSMQPVDENDAQRKENLDARNAAKVGQRRAALVERKPNIRQLTHKAATKPDDLEKFANSHIRFGGGDILISVECADDIDNYMRYLEVIYTVPDDFLKNVKSPITGRMRQILADWLYHVQNRFNLLNETLSLTINLLDRSLLAMNGSIIKTNFQLLGVTCLFISSKFEEITVPNVEDFVQIAGGVFTKEEVFQMEQKVLSALDFDLGAPHSIQFLRRYRFYVEPDGRTYQFAKYICEVATVCYSLAHHLPSTVAATAIWLASYTFGRTLVSNYLFDEVFKLDQATLFSTARSFVDHVINFASTDDNRTYALREKYQESVLEDFTAEHISKLNDFFDYGYEYSGFSSASTYSVCSAFEK